MIPSPRMYVMAAVLGTALGLVLDLIFGLTWWAPAVGFVAAVWLVFVSTAFSEGRGHGPDNIWTEMLDALDPGGERGRHVGRVHEAFRHPQLALYGLPPSWPGRRFIGAIGSGGIGKTARITNLQLGHGDPADPNGPELRVDSSVGDFGRESALRDLAEDLWRATDGRPARLEAEEFQAWLDARDREYRQRPTPAFTPVEVLIDGEPVSFDYLAAVRAWVAHSVVDGLQVTLHARNMDVDGVQLVRILDVEPYIRGSKLGAEDARIGRESRNPRANKRVRPPL